MAISNPKTDWNPSSIPSPADFNRIENNIAELNRIKEPNISVLPVSKGGTGAKTIAAARNLFGLGNTTGALPIANGGTGASNVADARSNLGIRSAASLDVLSGLCDETGNKIATFKSYIETGGKGYVLFENGILINWGTVPLGEDKNTTVTFLSADEKRCNVKYKVLSNKIIGAILTGILSNGNL